MSAVKPTPVSDCERQSVAGAAAQGIRLDGRRLLDFRDRHVQFGVERGSCAVRCGDTRVTAAITCNLTQPRAARPCEGSLHVAVDILDGCCEAPPRQTACLERLLEQCVRDSECCDLESLCLQADRLAWRLSLRVTVVQWGGAVAACAVHAAVAILHQHRRPAMRVTGEQVVSCRESQPVPLAMLHTPFLFTFAVLTSPKDDSYMILADPSLYEERVMQGAVHVAVNSYRELCGVQLSGAVVLPRDQILRCCNLAVQRVAAVQDSLRRDLADDNAARQQGGCLPWIADGLGPVLKKLGVDLEGVTSSVLIGKSDEQEDEMMSSSFPVSEQEPHEQDLEHDVSLVAENKVKVEKISDSDSEEEMQSVIKPELWDTGFV